jgi:hypothetical protein
MAYRTFFSFHYKPDITRAMTVRNSWVTKEDRDKAGFFDSSVFESKQRDSDDALRRFLREGLSNTSVTCVLVGTETARRKWVRYEILQSFVRGNGIFAARIHGIRNFQKQTAISGNNPLDSLAFAVRGDRVHLRKYMANGWEDAPDVPSMALSDVAYDLQGMANHTFSSLFPIYDYCDDDGYNNLNNWIDKAARQAGR